MEGKSKITLHGYFRSTASWRVRIALNLKGIDADHVFHHLRRGEQHAPSYLALNPQGLVPALTLGDGVVLTQSLAICEYLDETFPSPPLLPADPVQRAKARALAYIIACDTHPVQNLKILDRLRQSGLGDDSVKIWAATAIDEGLNAAAALLGPAEGIAGFAFGDGPGLFELCLIPQLANARRFGVDLRWPALAAIENRCVILPAFAAAMPEAQADAET
ncbi:maleylacetoacetate isomerase [Aquisediminimonas profunda]|uniref:maleylacetoacetate isomerase n=1 Tax=Aquisediminimonas profunda TaxID=1550733 RepID=UPI001C629DE7|nr:maleylacetoacetate isomerase [Aquisediminimonas profunda]